MEMISAIIIYKTDKTSVVCSSCSTVSVPLKWSRFKLFLLIFAYLDINLTLTLHHEHSLPTTYKVG